MRRRLWRVISRLIFFILALLLVLLLALQLPRVQSFLAKELVERISEKTGFHISLRSVRVSWVDDVTLNDLLIKDHHEDTLVYAGRLTANYQLKQLLHPAMIHLDDLEVGRLIVNLVKYDSLEKLNFSIFLNSLKSDEKKSNKKTQFAIDNIRIANLKTTFNDLTKPQKTDRLDASHLNLALPEVAVADLLIGDTISGHLVDFSALDRNSGFEVNKLKTAFQLSNQSLSLDDLLLSTPHSLIADSLQFYYNGLDDFSTFVDSVSFAFRFDQSRISYKDLSLLTGKQTLTSDITIDGLIWGTVGDFNIEDIRLGYGKSYLEGGLSCFGLPDLDQTFILADITDSHLLPGDLKPHIGELTTNLEAMGKIDFTGSFAGFLKDFVANGYIITDHGSIRTDINLKIPQDSKYTRYTGHLGLENLNLGVLLGDPMLGRVNLQAKIDGRGITKEVADFEADALIVQSEFKGYTYDTIKAVGSFADHFFDGQLYTVDPNCTISGEATIDFRGQKEKLHANTRVEVIHLDSLNLASRHISVSGDINLDVSDLDINTFTGSLTLDSTEIDYEGKVVKLDSVRFTAVVDSLQRRMSFYMPGLKADLAGDFKLTDIAQDLPAIAAGYAKKLQLETDSTDFARSGEKYRARLSASIKDLSPYLEALEIPFSVGKDATLEARFRQSKNANVSLFFSSDSLRYKNFLFEDPVLEINGSNQMEGEGILTNFIFESATQQLAGVPQTEGLLVEGIWFGNSISLTTIVEQPTTATDLRLESSFTLSKDSIVMRMLPSDMEILNDDWRFNPSNRVVLREGNSISIENFEIFDASESISIQGIFSDSLASDITIQMEDLNMNKVGLFSQAPVSGYLNGSFSIFRQEGGVPFKFDGDFLLKNLNYDKLNVGDISGSSQWDPVAKQVYVEVKVEREDFKAIEVKGYYTPASATDQLDFNLIFDQADLKMGQPFLKNNFSDLDGKANGNLKISGMTDRPKVVGECRISKGQVTINYLNTQYTFDGRVDFDPRVIRIVDFGLTDRKGSQAYVAGYLRHEGFKNLITRLDIRANKFEFLNTTALENELYYGSASGTGTIKVDGPLNDIKIKANIKTESGTRFFIPISEKSSVGQEDYITFVDLSDTTRVEEEEDNFNFSGLTMDFDIEVTPDAYCELIFDIKTGDIIRGRGRGNIKLSLNSDGEFNMFGPLEITEGAYNFTVRNIINKEFEVVPGSRITWYGEPYSAILNLDATYLQRASFENLKNPEEQIETELSNRVPVLVVLQLDGGMLSPNIDFDIRLQNEADAADDAAVALSQIKADEQELRRQVISLLFLKRFSPRQSFSLSGGGNMGSSVSEFLSSQVSYLISQIDENLEVEVDLVDLNNEAFNTFQLRFAYTLLGGRLKVTRGGTFGNQNNEQQNLLNDIVGDWSVEYSLTQDGRLRAKVFRNSSQRILGNTPQQNQETGVSLRFVHSFNDLSELLTIQRNEGIRRREEEEPGTSGQ